MTYQPGRDLEEKLNQLYEQRQNYENCSKTLICASKAITMYCVSGGIFPKEELVEGLAQHAPQIFENETITDYLSELPRRIGRAEAKGLSLMLLDEGKKYIQELKKLEQKIKIEEERPKYGLSRTMYAMFNGGEEPDIISDEYRPNDGTIHSWLENLCIDFHNHIAKSFKK